MKSRIVFYLKMPMVKEGKVLADETYCFHRTIEAAYVPPVGSTVHFDESFMGGIDLLVTEHDYIHRVGKDAEQIACVDMVIKNLLTMTNDQVISIFDKLEANPEWYGT